MSTFGRRVRATVTAGFPHRDGSGTPRAAHDTGDEAASLASRLRDSELRTMLRHVAVTIIAFDVQGMITSFEGYGARVAGDGESRVGRQVADVYQWLGHVEPAVRDVLAGAEAAFRGTRDGQHWDVRVGPVLDADGAVEGGVAVAMDVTAAVHAVTELEASERRFRALSVHSADIALLAQPDGTLTFVSAAVRAQLGCEPEDVVGRNGFDFVHPDDVGAAMTAFRLAAEDPTVRPRVEFRLRHANGSWRWVEQVYVNLLADPAIGAIASNLRDVTEHRQTLAALASSEEQYRTIVESAQEGIWVVDADYRTTFANQRMAELLGTEAGELLGRPLLDFFFPEDRPAVRAQQVARRAEAHRFDDVRYRRADGTELWAMVVSSPLVDPAGVLTGFVGMVTDITERRANALRMERWALYDDLTGCGTRRNFETLLEAALAEQDGLSPAVLMVGIDNMNDINEIAGYVTGDAALREVGKRLRDDVEAIGVARASGDEFLLLLDVETSADAFEAADRVRCALRRLINVDQHEISVGSSVGIAPPRPSATADELLRDAEAALHEAKRLGKGRTVSFDEDMRRAATERVKIEAGLRRAVTSGELEVYYQPIYHLSSGELQGCEALVRWNHPEAGLLDPGAFIPVAERTDLIVAIGTVVLQEACRQAAAWAALRPSSPPLRMNVNIAARQIADPGLLGTVRAAIADSGVDPRALCLEITESVVMEHPERAAEVLRALRELGVRVAIDDFGTGHSSLGSLRRFPVDILKIDRSFVAGLGVCPEDRAVVDAIVALAHVLGFTIVAEGVETGAQLEQLLEARCDGGQGFYWCPPLSGHALTERLSNPRRGSVRPRRPPHRGLNVGSRLPTPV